MSEICSNIQQYTFNMPDECRGFESKKPLMFFFTQDKTQVTVFNMNDSPI